VKRKMEVNSENERVGREKYNPIKYGRRKHKNLISGFNE
jgi:hypothetical protein